MSKTGKTSLSLKLTFKRGGQEMFASQKNQLLLPDKTSFFLKRRKKASVFELAKAYG